MSNVGRLYCSSQWPGIYSRLRDKIRSFNPKWSIFLFASHALQPPLGTIIPAIEPYQQKQCLALTSAGVSEANDRILANLSGAGGEDKIPRMRRGAAQSEKIQKMGVESTLQSPDAE
jgi:hypothetical protein